MPGCYYRYVAINEYTIKNILNNQLWFTNPFDFNDPFDCQIRIDFSCSEEELKKRIPKLPGMLIEEYEAIIKFYIENPSELNKWGNIGMSRFHSKLGVSCFCLEKENILMWSHYADSHKGLCLKFDFTEDPRFITGYFSDKLKLFPIDKVEYVTHIPKLKYLEDSDDSFNRKVLLKSKHWEYEKEYRIISNIQGGIKYNKEALCEITFGCEVDLIDRADIIKLIKSCNYLNVKFIQAKKCEDRFGLKFEEIPEDEIIKICNS